ncbi:MAG: N-acetylmannosamine-6-phosphate 2-epimerase [Acholeplasmataceae bacterium]|jgi:N-acylglucosamine-6-phosphate 2-epimerase|nr:N-acetylmannosamine-6-phosphate 2-epimerase [Acholeplasmataceae bacterium]
MSKEKLINQLKGGLIVSCQALEEEPLHGADIMSKMALAAKMGGAVAIRANGVLDIQAIKQKVDLPVIGIIKKEYPNLDRYITPTLKEIKKLIEIGVDIIAMDATQRVNQDEVSFKEKVDYIHQNGLLAMADISTLEEGLLAEKNGFDFISTTLSGYTNYSRKKAGPDIKLVKELVKQTNSYIIAEGKIRDRADLKKVLKHNPFAVVIGGAITRPQCITKLFVETLKGK